MKITLIISLFVITSINLPVLTLKSMYCRWICIRWCLHDELKEKGESHEQSPLQVIIQDFV